MSITVSLARLPILVDNVGELDLVGVRLFAGFRLLEEVRLGAAVDLLGVVGSTAHGFFTSHG